MKVKLTIDTAQMSSLLNSILETLRSQPCIEGLEVETLVLMDWHQRNFIKVRFAPLPCKISLKPHEALSLRRLLFGIDLNEPVLDIFRNEICGEIQKQIPNLI
ncbi:MAG: hypothetical protein EBR82_29310 [Caulobacteraceae bacterium]|jgi:hypothetical protein|nr:hypothetical protein [Caulobacteraceae bacterium]